MLTYFTRKYLLHFEKSLIHIIYTTVICILLWLTVFLLSIFLLKVIWSVRTPLITSCEIGKRGVHRKTETQRKDLQKSKHINFDNATEVLTKRRNAKSNLFVNEWQSYNFGS